MSHALLNPIKLLELALFRFSKVYHLLDLEMGELDFSRLPEYSCSLPMGQVTGKRWRCNVLAYGGRGLGGPLWIIGEFGEVSEDGKQIKLNWYRPSLTPQRALLI